MYFVDLSAGKPAMKLEALVYMASNRGEGPLNTAAEPCPSTITLRGRGGGRVGRGGGERVDW